MSPAEQDARTDLAAAFRWAVRNNLHEGICNHFSLLLSGEQDRFLINAQGLHWREVTASNLAVVNGATGAVEGDAVVEPTALTIHWRVHRAAPAARCVMHTHMPYATVLASLKDKRLKVINQNAIRYWGRIAFDDDYNGVVLDAAEGDRIAATLDGKPILMMGNHGVLVSGTDVAHAWDDLYYLERACQTLVLAMQTQRDLDEIPTQLVIGAARAIAEAQDFAAEHFAALRRILDRDEPDYRA